MMAGIIAFLQAIPDLIKLCQALQARADAAGVNTKVANDVKTLHEAFNAKDPSKINALFNS